MAATMHDKSMPANPSKRIGASSKTTQSEWQGLWYSGLGRGYHCGAARAPFSSQEVEYVHVEQYDVNCMRPQPCQGSYNVFSTRPCCSSSCRFVAKQQARSMTQLSCGTRGFTVFKSTPRTSPAKTGRGRCRGVGFILFLKLWDQNCVQHANTH